MNRNGSIMSGATELHNNPADDGTPKSKISSPIITMAWFIDDQIRG